MKARWLYLALFLLLLLDAALIRWWYGGWRERRVDPAIEAAARRYGMDPALIKAVVWKESRFDPRARGQAGEIGLMQIREPAAREWAQAENIRGFHMNLLVDPMINTRAGTWYLRKLMRRYTATDNPIAYALADYNAGRTHVLRWNGGAALTNSARFLEQMDFPGTRQYVLDVQARLEHYRALQPPSIRSAP
ncbi:MAG TPA: lytic transglycosylase domain-containing protein [Candidatus Paceibacterota bacterium]|nr:lytic transglycosylase domain-containing protein [Verrucomicrobiota bacterium]HOX03134.1 lytic transglycosylase domain-containing protein [Verrucomicrobiota bacterium]HRZ45882.1 lytic transglycosylase domain-containing protein [Candidatus Paceibacterota bacterium]HRZ93121.1 lytic transglycosylase domain-containing protein [Candidatus Paceibacterota bacterium]